MFIKSQQRYLFLDENSEKDSLSEITAGIILKSLGMGIKVAYIDFSNNSKKLINFFENICISKKFISEFKNFLIDCFTFKNELKKNEISFNCSHLPQVEFSTISFEKLKEKISQYNLVIIENFNSNLMSEKNFKLFLDEISCDTICITKNLNIYNFLKSNFNHKLKISSFCQKTIFSNSNLNLIVGKKFGSTTLACGLALKFFIEKKEVKWISFIKKNNYFEESFFIGLKKFKPSKIYGSFDFVINKKYNLMDKKKDTLESFEVLKTATKKNNYTFADEFLNSEVLEKIEKNKIVDFIKNLQNFCILTGKKDISFIEKYAENKIEILKE